MRHTNHWLEYLRQLSSQGADLAIYALQWAHDPRCVKTGAAHRRVGSHERTHHPEWLNLGYASRGKS